MVAITLCTVIFAFWTGKTVSIALLAGKVRISKKSIRARSTAAIAMTIRVNWARIATCTETAWNTFQAWRTAFLANILQRVRIFSKTTRRRTRSIWGFEVTVSTGQTIDRGVSAKWAERVARKAKLLRSVVASWTYLEARVGLAVIKVSTLARETDIRTRTIKARKRTTTANTIPFIRCSRALAYTIACW